VSEDGNPIKLSVENMIGRVTLCRPSKRNAINTQMAMQFEAACRELARRNIRVCILDAEGEVFCSGADTSDPNMSAAFRAFYDALIGAPALWISCVSGPVIGAAVALVAATPVVVATPSAWFSLPEIGKIGSFPHAVVDRAKPFVSTRWLMAMALSGEKSSVEVAARGGLITEIVSDGHEQVAATKWAKLLANSDISVVSDARSSWLGAARPCLTA
jgi:enoyl-CoA hydratase/carnithine racemase